MNEKEHLNTWKYVQCAKFAHTEFLLDVIKSIDTLASRTDKEIEIKVKFEGREADTDEFVGYGAPVWIKIPK